MPDEKWLKPWDKEYWQWWAGKYQHGQKPELPTPTAQWPTSARTGWPVWKGQELGMPPATKKRYVEALRWYLTQQEELGEIEKKEATELMGRAEWMVDIWGVTERLPYMKELAGMLWTPEEVQKRVAQIRTGKYQEKLGAWEANVAAIEEENRRRMAEWQTQQAGRQEAFLEQQRGFTRQAQGGGTWLGKAQRAITRETGATPSAEGGDLTGWIAQKRQYAEKLEPLAKAYKQAKASDLGQFLPENAGQIIESYERATKTWKAAEAVQKAEAAPRPSALGGFTVGEPSLPRTPHEEAMLKRYGEGWEKLPETQPWLQQAYPQLGPRWEKVSMAPPSAQWFGQLLPSQQQQWLGFAEFAGAKPMDLLGQTQRMLPKSPGITPRWRPAGQRTMR